VSDVERLFQPKAQEKALEFKVVVADTRPGW
jgi:translation initiation factor 2B subunit (eIF-2B alpha/beta/delta family)